MFVVVKGSIFDGMAVHGPFKTFDEAFQWSYFLRENWTIVKLERPSNYDNYDLACKKSEIGVVIKGSLAEGVKLYGPFIAYGDDMQDWAYKAGSPICDVIDAVLSV